MLTIISWIIYAVLISRICVLLNTRQKLINRIEETEAILRPYANELDEVINALHDAGLRSDYRTGGATVARVKLLIAKVAHAEAGRGARPYIEATCVPLWIDSRIEVNAGKLICGFAKAMAAELYAIQLSIAHDGGDVTRWMKRSTGWPVPGVQYELLEKVANGLPVSAAISCAYLWYHNEETSMIDFVSMGPGLEQAVGTVLAGGNMEAINQLVPSRVKPHFGYDPAQFGNRGFARRIITRAFEKGKIGSLTLHDLMAFIEETEL